MILMFPYIIMIYNTIYTMGFNNNNNDVLFSGVLHYQNFFVNKEDTKDAQSPKTFPSRLIKTDQVSESTLTPVYH